MRLIVEERFAAVVADDLEQVPEVVPSDVEFLRTLLLDDEVLHAALVHHGEGEVTRLWRKKKLLELQ